MPCRQRFPEASVQDATPIRKGAASGLTRGFEIAFKAIDALRDRHPLWFSGPPGCGKRAFICGYAASRKLGSVYFETVAGMTDPTPVLQRRQAHPAVPAASAKENPTATEWPVSVLMDRRQAADLVQRLCAGDGDIELIVIDQAHLLDEACVAFAPMFDCLRQFHGKVRFVFISHLRPPDPIVRLCCRNRGVMFSWYGKDSRTRDLSDGGAHLPLPAVEKPYPMLVSSDYEAMRAIVITLEATYARADMDNGDFSQSMAYQTSASIFRRLPEPARRFFLRTAMLTKMTDAMAEALSDDADPRRLLTEALYPLGDRQASDGLVNTYRYHPMLQRFLRCFAHEEFGAEGLAVEVERAVTILFKHHLTEEAFSLLPDIGDDKIKCDRIIAHAVEMMAGNQRPLLERTINSLSIDTCLSDPRLSIWLGLIKLHQNPSGLDSFFEKLFQQFRRKKDIAWMCLAWIGAVDAILLSLVPLSALDRWIDQPMVDQVLTEAFVPGPWATGRFLSGLLLALTLRRPGSPDLPKVYHALCRAQTQAAGHDDAPEMFLRLCLYQMVMGQISDMDMAAAALKKTLGLKGTPPVVLARAQYVLGLYLQLCGQYAELERLLENTAEMADLSGSQCIREAVACTLVKACLARNNVGLARRHFESRSCNYFAGNAWENFHCFSTAAAIEAAAQKYAKADSLLDSAAMAANELGLPAFVAVCRIYRVHLCIAMQQYKEAGEQLDEARRLSRQITGDVHRLSLAFAEVSLKLALKDQTAALALLAGALAECRVWGLYGVYMGPPAAVEKICLSALEAGIEKAFVRALVRARNVKPKSPPVQIDDWPWPIRIYTLGRFAILSDNEKVSFPKKAKKKPLSLLKALVSLGGRGVREEIILDALWPEADADFAHQTLATTLHRLRKMLGHHNAVLVKGGCLTLNTNYIWVDAWAFERTIGAAAKLIHTGLVHGQHEYAVSKAQTAIDYYRGPYLGSETWEPWAVNYGERLRNKYLRIVGKLGHFWERSNQLEEAVECFLKSLEVDNTDEVAYRRLMACYIRMGSRSKALSTYRRCKKILNDNLGMVPSADIENLKRSLEQPAH